MDTLTKKERSERMARVRGKNTKPELIVRSLVHRLGFRFRLHDAQLPGKPDIILKRLKKVIFIHGCFWHRHGQCRRLSIPGNNSKFWRKKFSDTLRRDRRIQKKLAELGWKLLVIWECEIKSREALECKLFKFLKSG